VRLLGADQLGQLLLAGQGRQGGQGGRRREGGQVEVRPRRQVHLGEVHLRRRWELEALQRWEVQVRGGGQVDV
jgi:hypothetical protein